MGIRDGKTVVGVQGGRVVIEFGNDTALLTPAGARNVAEALLQCADLLEGKLKPEEVGHREYNKDGTLKGAS